VVELFGDKGSFAASDDTNRDAIATLQYRSTMKKKPAELKRRRAASRERMRMVSVALPVELHRQIALVALDTRIAMNEIIRDAIKLWLAQRKGRKE
jgi:hypothetical protein